MGEGCKYPPAPPPPPQIDERPLELDPAAPPPCKSTSKIPAFETVNVPDAVNVISVVGTPPIVIEDEVPPVPDP
jgi:hypothetical protein